MKKLIATLLIMTFILTVFVACGDKKSDGGSNSGSSSKTNGTVDANTSSVASLTSEQEDLWGDVSIGFGTEDPVSSSVESSSDKTDSVSSGDSSSSAASSTTASANGTSSSASSSVPSSEDKDQGYEDWIPIG